MYALQRPQCNPRNQLPQVRLPESSPQEQGKKSIILSFTIWRENEGTFHYTGCKIIFALMPVFSVFKKSEH
jgi:hypothetical protein